MAAARASTAVRWASVSSLGICTSTVTSRSPVPLRVSTPRPLTRNTLPDDVPGGIRMLTGSPITVGTFTLVPSAASAKVTGTTSVMSRPRRPNRRSGLTCTTTNRSPAGPPFLPGPPRPFSRMRWPSSTPAGMRTFTSRLRRTAPDPEHWVQGSVTIEPRPPQATHGDENEKNPWLSSLTPRPPHWAHIWGVDPGRDPLPPHTGHPTSDVSWMVVVSPEMASVNPRVSSASRSLPRRGPEPWGAPPPRRPPPNRLPNNPPMSSALKLAPAPPKPPGPPAPPGPPKPPMGPSLRTSSYSVRLASSPSTSYAPETSLNRSSAVGSSGLASGCS